MSTSINNYVCNIIAGREPISNLYAAIDRARQIRDKSGKFCYKVTFKGIGTKMYDANQLICLDDKALCASLDSLLAPISGTPTVDQYVLLLLKAKNEFRNLLQARYRALYLRSQAKIFHYIFNNPLGSAAGVKTNRIIFSNATNFLKFFCECQGQIFNPLLIIGGIN